MKINKLYIAAALLLALTLLFAACAKPAQPNGTEPSSEAGSSENATAEPGTELSNEELLSQIYGETQKLPYVYLASDITELKRGDTVDIMVKIADAQNVGAYQLLLTFDETVFSFEKYKEGLIDDLIISSDQLNNQVQTYGITVETVDLYDDTVLTVTLKVADDAAPGDAAVTAEISQFIVGTDDSGDVTADLAAVKEMSAEIGFKIAG